MNDERHKQQLLAGKQGRLVAFIKEHPDQVDELFRFADPQVRDAAMTNIKQLDLCTVSLLCDRIDYLGRTRIVHRTNEVPRCRGKVIYTEKDAHGKVNRIWAEGRGRMRVYHCPLCKGYHLTHTAHKDPDRRVA